MSVATDSRQRGSHEGVITAYCEQVGVGVKPVASCQIPLQYVDDAKRICENCGCLYHIQEVPGYNWVMIYIYKRPFLLDIIKYSLTMNDADAVQIFFRGCMYGYEMAAIEKMAACAAVQRRDGSSEQVDQYPLDPGFVAPGTRGAGVALVQDDCVATP